MTDTLMTRTPRAQLPPAWQPAWDMLNGLTGSATFVEVFGQAPQLLDFVMNQFYMKLFFGGAVAQRYKQLARLRLSLLLTLRGPRDVVPFRPLYGYAESRRSTPGGAGSLPKTPGF